MDVLTIGLFIAVAGLVILIVYIMYSFVQPVRNSPAKYFIEAMKKKKTVIALDNGSNWVFKISDREDEGYMTDKTGSMIFITPNSVKYGVGVKFAVGEAYRYMTIDPKLIEIIQLAKKNKITPTELREAIKQYETQELKKEVEDATEKTDTEGNAEKGTV